MKDDRLLDVSSHILFSPIQCKVPLPAFEKLLFFISDEDKRSRDLLRNLCSVLGGKVCRNLTNKVNYLVYESLRGSDYERARALGVKRVTIDWILNYINQNKVDIDVQSQSLENKVCRSDLPAEDHHSAFGLSMYSTNRIPDLPDSTIEYQERS